jgi:hypothetical protein
MPLAFWAASGPEKNRKVSRKAAKGGWPGNETKQKESGMASTDLRTYIFVVKKPIHLQICCIYIKPTNR